MKNHFVRSLLATLTIFTVILIVSYINFSTKVVSFSGTATSANFIQLEDGTGYYLEDNCLSEGREYTVLLDTKGTDNIDDDTIIRIK